jgi:hypothetical protein
VVFKPFVYDELDIWSTWFLRFSVSGSGLNAL